MWRLAAAAAVIVLGTSATALASGGYLVRVTAASPVATGHSFTVTARGLASQKALLYVYLSPKSCLTTWVKEARRVGRYKSGESYFLLKEGPRRAKEGYDYGWVTGSFKKSFTAHAGSTAEREHVCAYLATPNAYGGYRVNAARGSAAYRVSNS